MNSTVPGTLEEGARALEIQLSANQLALLEDYLDLLGKWNRIHNLTAVRDRNDMVVQHLLDSLAILPHLPSGTLLDVGSGGGLPGIPVSIAQPDRSVTLLDSNEKKAAFLRQAAAELRLPRLSVHCGRVEAFSPAERFDVIVSRAFSELANFVRWTSHLLSEGGRMIAMKGVRPDEEIEALPAGFKVTRIQPLSVPQLGAQRHLIWMEAV